MFNFFKNKEKAKEKEQLQQIKRERGYTTNIVQPQEYISTLYNDENFSTIDLDKLRAISRERSRTNQIISAYARLGENNVVGRGFSLMINKKQKFKTGEKLEESILNEWNQFCERENFDASNKLNLREFCRVLTRQLLIDGENLVKIIREIPTEDNPYGVQFQMLDVNRIDTNYNTEKIRKGMEYDDRGRLKRIHLRKSVESMHGLRGLNRASTSDGFENASDVIYFANFLMAEQSRGTPYTASALSSIKDLEVFDKHTMQAAQIGTMFSLYIKKDPTIANDVNNLDGGDRSYGSISLSSGGIYELPPGESIETHHGNYPVDLYNNYVNKKINQIARALGLSSTFLANEIGSANYAIARFMSNEDREFYQTLQQKIIDGFLSVVFREFLKALVLHKGYNSKILNLSYSFICSNFEEIDAVKTQKAKNMELTSMRKSFSEFARESGKSFEDIAEEYASDLKLMANKFGVPVEILVNKFFQVSE